MKINVKQTVGYVPIKMCAIVKKTMADLSLMASPTERFVIARRLDSEEPSYVAVINNSFTIINEKTMEAVVRPMDILCAIEMEENEVEVNIGQYRETKAEWLGLANG